MDIIKHYIFYNTYIELCVIVPSKNYHKGLHYLQSVCVCLYACVWRERQRETKKYTESNIEKKQGDPRCPRTWLQLVP